MDDMTLVTRCRSGDEAASRILYERYSGKIYQLIFRYFNNPDDAADLVQETFIRVFKSISSFRGDAKLGTWIYRIATNICYDELRRRKLPEVSLDAGMESEDGKMEWQLADQSAGPYELAEKNERMTRLQECIAKLPEEQRTAIVLRDVSGFSYQDIAEIEKCSLGTVKSRICRGRVALVEMLKQDGELFVMYNGHRGKGGMEDEVR